MWISEYSDSFVTKDRDVTVGEMSRLTGYSLDLLSRFKFFYSLKPKIGKTGSRVYRYADVMQAMRRYGLGLPERVYPDARFSVYEMSCLSGIIAAQLDSHIRKGFLICHTDTDGTRYVIKREFDRYMRHMYPMAVISRMRGMLTRNSVADIFGTNPYKVLVHERNKEIFPVVKGFHRYYSREVLTAYVSRRRRKMVSNPMRYYGAAAAAVYCGISKKELARYAAEGKIRTVKEMLGPRAGRITYLVEDLDRIVETADDEHFYGNGKLLKKDQIRYRFRVCSAWVTKYITTNFSVRIVGLNGEPRTRSLDEHSCVHGYFTEDVERVVSEGHGIDPVADRPTAFLSEQQYAAKSAAVSREKSRICKRWAKFTPPCHAVKSADIKSPVPEFDSIEAAIYSVVGEKSRNSALAKKAAAAICGERYAKRRRIRDILGLSGESDASVPTPSLSYMSEMSVPYVSTLVYGVGKSEIYSMMKHIGAPKSRSYARIRRWLGKDERMSDMEHVCRSVKRLGTQMNGMYPDWIILIRRTSCILDPFFEQKLALVPDNVGAVGPFGYEVLPESLDWNGCKSTRGMFTAYSSDGRIARHVFGRLSCDGSHYVQAVNGPFVAIRGAVVEKFVNRLHELRRFIKGWNHIGPAMSSVAAESHMAVMQISADCMECMDYYSEIHGVEWNADHLYFTKLFGNGLVTLGNERQERMAKWIPGAANSESH